MTRRNRTAALAGIALAAAAFATLPAQVQSASAPTAATVEPRLPDASDIYAAWPEQARQLGIEGSVDLSCDFDGAAQPRECNVMSERPVGMGFGRAAMALVPRLTMAVVNGPDGKPLTISRRPTIEFACNDRCKPFPKWDLSILWSAAPSADDVKAAYPPDALSKGIAGVAVLACHFTAEGGLADCKTDTELPQARGFAAAALSLAGKFHAQGNLKDVPVRIPVRFAVNNGQLVTATPPARRGPTVFDIVGAIPSGATGAGQATLACRIGAEGGFDACAARLESPAGQGFGQAALSLKDKYRFNLWTPMGLPVIGAVMAAPFKFPDPNGPRPSMITNPDWSRQPDPGQLTRVFPERAQRMGVSGKVTLDCVVLADGHLADCSLDEESPANFGFGDAALRLSGVFEMKPQTRDGAPVGGARVTIPINFNPGT